MPQPRPLPHRKHQRQRRPNIILRLPILLLTRTPLRCTPSILTSIIYHPILMVCRHPHLLGQEIILCTQMLSLICILTRIHIHHRTQYLLPNTISVSLLPSLWHRSLSVISRPVTGSSSVSAPVPPGPFIPTPAQTVQQSSSQPSSSTKTLSAKQSSPQTKPAASSNPPVSSNSTQPTLPTDQSGNLPTAIHLPRLIRTTMCSVHPLTHQCRLNHLYH